MEEKEAREALWFNEEEGRVLARTAVAAKFFGVTPQTLSNWVKDGCPRYEYGVYDLRAVQEYRVRTEYGINPSGAAPVNPAKMTPAEQKLAAEQKLKAAQADTAEFKNRLLQGEYIERSEVVNQLRAFFTVLRRSAEGLAGQLALEVSHLVDGDERRQLEHQLAETIGRALEQMSVAGVYHAGD